MMRRDWKHSLSWLRASCMPLNRVPTDSCFVQGWQKICIRCYISEDSEKHGLAPLPYPSGSRVTASKLRYLEDYPCGRGCFQSQWSHQITHCFVNIPLEVIWSKFTFVSIDPRLYMNIFFNDLHQTFALQLPGLFLGISFDFGLSFGCIWCVMTSPVIGRWSTRRNGMWHLRQLCILLPWTTRHRGRSETQDKTTLQRLI